MAIASIQAPRWVGVTSASWSKTNGPMGKRRSLIGRSPTPSRRGGANGPGRSADSLVEHHGPGSVECHYTEDRQRHLHQEGQQHQAAPGPMLQDPRQATGSEAAEAEELSG